MAKQVGPLFITGTIDGIIFYKLGDQYYIRSKGDYKSAKRMRKDPRLQRTMQKAAQFGGASKLVKEVYYRHLPIEVRKHGLFGKLTGMVNGWLQKGKSKEEVKALLIAHCQTLASMTVAVAAAPTIVNELPTTTNAVHTMPLVTQKPVAVPSTRKAKKARYLSHWKVKRCGRLQVPKNDVGSLNISGSESGTILTAPFKNKRGLPSLQSNAVKTPLRR